jgi:phage terminase large subunit
VEIELPDKAKMLFKPKRFKVLYGGRGSAKSRSVATALVIRAIEKKTRILCTREMQLSIRESVHKLLSDTIERLGVNHLFEITNAWIRAKNGSEFIFEGLHNNVGKIKSMEGVNICWVEEAENIKEDSWSLLIPTIREDDSEIWVVFNPHDILDATYKMFITPYPSLSDTGEHEDASHHIIKMNHTDNPWFPQELQNEMESCRINDYKKFLHVWQGQPIADYDDSIIDPLWIQASVDAHKKLGWTPKGVISLGFDPADGGKDSKALCIRHGSLVTHAEEWNDGDITYAIDKAFEKATDEKVTDFVYDQIGVGAAVKDYVTRAQGRDSFTITGFNASSSPILPDKKYKDDRLNSDTFRNRRAQAFWLLRDRFEATYRAVELGQYCDPDDMISLSSGLTNLDELSSELARVQRKRGMNTLIQIESKDEMKRRGMASPGLADSLMYAFSNPPIKIKSKYDDWEQNING